MDKNFQIKLILVGDSGVGKSCIHQQLTNDSFKPIYKSTIGIDYGSYLIRKNDYNFRLQLWDTAGQEMFHSLVRTYFRNKIGAIVVFDSTDRETFISVRQWIKEIKLFCSPDIIITLVGNKIDLKDKRAVFYEEANKFAKDHDINYFEVSAKDNKQIIAMFEKITETITDKFIINRDLTIERLPDGISQGGNYIVSIDKPIEKKGCCY
jgi:small GTP-binding protein